MGFGFGLTTRRLFVDVLLATPVFAMHRADSSNYFLFIEPEASEKAKQPVKDELTASLEAALSQAKQGVSDYSNLQSKGDFTEGGGYRGMHFAEDGETSDVHDYLLPNGFITNSLCVHYAQYYRDVIPATELRKLKKLHDYMQKQSTSPDL